VPRSQLLREQTNLFETVIELDGEPFLIGTGVAEDPQYLTARFKLEPDGSKWNPRAVAKLLRPAR